MFRPLWCLYIDILSYVYSKHLCILNKAHVHAHMRVHTCTHTCTHTHTNNAREFCLNSHITKEALWILHRLLLPHSSRTAMMSAVAVNGLRTCYPYLWADHDTGFQEQSMYKHNELMLHWSPQSLRMETPFILTQLIMWEGLNVTYLRTVMAQLQCDVYLKPTHIGRGEHPNIKSSM